MDSSSAILLVVLMFLNYFSTLSVGQSSYFYHFCMDEGDNLSANSTYETNLKTLVSSFTSVNDYGFYNVSEGQDPDQVYSIALCWGDVKPNDCLSCINNASRDLRFRCPNQKEAIIWFDNCMFRYSNHSPLDLEENSPIASRCNVNNATNVNAFSEALGTLARNLAIRASYGDSHRKIAAGTTPATTFDPVYVYVQCTPNLSQLGCNNCLSETIRRIPSRCKARQGGRIFVPSRCEARQGGRIFVPSCTLRFETYLFYNETADGLSSPPPTTTLVSSPPTNNTTTISGSKQNWIRITASLSSVLALAMVSSFALIIWRRRISKEDRENGQLLDLKGGIFGNEYSNNEHLKSEMVGGTMEFPSIQLSLINVATNSFSNENKLGQGGFGPVYKGTLADGKEIAVKRLSRSSGQGLIEFKNEVWLIARLQHRNLVRLIGCCLENHETLLVYEYMPNRSLDFFLFDSNMSVQLDWRRRFSIIIGIAKGIMYLHEDSRLKIIHRDLKASNILLDGEMIPKISDFGMARIFDLKQNEANTNRVVGTYGYMAPEYAMEGLFSVKSDVFSFGVLLLEIISGKKNNGFHLYKHGESLLTFAWKLWSTDQGMKLIDPILSQTCVASEVLKCIHIGLLCVQEDPSIRPTMSSVMGMMGSNKTVTLQIPTEPAFSSVGRIVAKQPSLPVSVNGVTLSILSPR